MRSPAETPPLLSRIRLQRNAATGALLPLLTGGENARGPAEHRGHHLIWSLFADHAERKRDFLWTATGREGFLTLSARPPVDSHGLFKISEPKAFTPALAGGDRLRFRLHANPVVQRMRNRGRRRVVKHDVVTDALRDYSPAQRRVRQNAVARDSGIGWLHNEGRRHGFEIEDETTAVGNYRRHVVGRGRKPPIHYATLDFEGTLKVTDAAALVDKIRQGFGSSRAFGCGLMLLRRC